jgi:sugar phosphate isomerase/epimerase
MKLGLGSIAFIYDNINRGKFESSKELLLNAIERTFNFAERNDIKICELILDPPEILVSEEKQAFIDLCNSFPSIKKQFHAPYAYLSLCTHNPWILDATIECYIESAEVSKAIGAEVFTIHPGNAQFLHQSYNGVNNCLIDAVNFLLEKIKNFQLITSLENMPKMAGFFLKHDEFNKFFSDINRGDIFLTWDTGHSASCNDNIEELWNKLHNRIKNIHLVENFKNDLDIHPSLGKGSVDFQLVFELANKFNYKGAMIIELHKVEDLPESIDYIQHFF